VFNYLMSVFGGVSRAIRLPPGWRPGAMGACGRRCRPRGAFADLLAGALRRHGGLQDQINRLIDALVDQEDLHVMIMDVISAPPPDEFALSYAAAFISRYSSTAPCGPVRECGVKRLAELTSAWAMRRSHPRSHAGAATSVSRC